jgi:hypothetical protein
MPPDTTDIITATIPRFREISGIGRSKIYQMLDAGELESVHVGARRLIVVDSYRRLVARLQAAESGAGRRCGRDAALPHAAA